MAPCMALIISSMGMLPPSSAIAEAEAGPGRRGRGRSAALGARLGLCSPADRARTLAVAASGGSWGIWRWCRIGHSKWLCGIHLVGSLSMEEVARWGGGEVEAR